VTRVLSPVAFPALGTTAALMVTDPGSMGPALDLVEREIAAIDRACSRFRPDSELTRLNAAPGRPIAVSALLLEAVEVALRAAALTGGVVDPTVGTAMRILGYDRDFAQVQVAGPPVRVTLRPVPGWRLVRPDARTSTIEIPAGVELDLGATAKALCADRAARAAAEATGSGVLVSLGGDIAVAGVAPSGGWRVRVTDDHAAPADGPGQTVLISSGGLATSGISVRRWARGGRMLHHLVHPATGLPAEPYWRTASVAAASCVDANIATTAAIILGPDAQGWLARQRLPGRLVGIDGEVVRVGGWPAEDA
jgi:FAD:protein FMN transferase